jgi:hypothetical protein
MKTMKTDDPLRTLLEKMVGNLYEQAKSKMPEKGAFDVVYEREDVSEMRLGLTHLILKISNVPLEGSLDKRYLELAAMNYPNPYGAESVVGYGNTKDILERLQDDDLLDKLVEKVPKLAADIDFDYKHPY